MKIVIYNDNSWKYVRDREFVKDSSIYTKYWDTGTLFPYKEYPLSEMPASLAIDLVDSLKCYHYPHKGSIRSKYGIRHRRRHQGVDIPIKTGDPVYATFDGRVRISEYNRGGYGNLIIVRHDNGLKPTTDTSPNGSCRAANGSRQDRSSAWAVRRAAAPARTCISKPVITDRLSTRSG